MQLSKIGHHFRKYSDLKIDAIKKYHLIVLMCKNNLQIKKGEKKIRKLRMICDVEN